MNSRLDLHNKLISIIGNNHVYYQSPESMKIEYPCIRYSLDDREPTFADNKKYINRKRYVLIFIDKLPDNTVIDKLLELPLSSYDRHYTSDNLNHDVITLYY